MKEKFWAWLTSPVAWGIIGFFLIGGLEKIEPSLSGHALGVVQNIVLVLGFIFHPTNLVGGRPVKK